MIIPKETGRWFHNDTHVRDYNFNLVFITNYYMNYFVVIRKKKTDTTSLHGKHCGFII